MGGIGAPARQPPRGHGGGDGLTNPVLEVGFPSLCLLGVQCCQNASKVSRNERFKELAEEVRDSGRRGFGCDARTGKGQGSGDSRRAQIACLRDGDHGS